MLDRRSFLENSILANILPIVGGGSVWPVIMQRSGHESGNKKRIQSPAARVLSVPGRFFIAHRGVHLKKTIAGENSLESIRLAKRAGFECIEMDVRLSSDGQAVVMHDETLNRTV